MSLSFFRAGLFIACAAVAFATVTKPAELSVGTALATLDKIYSGDPDAAIEDSRRLQAEHAGEPLPLLLEGEALWWKIWCTSAEFRYGMTYARHRPKIAADQHYLDLAAQVAAISEERIARRDSAEMRFYAGMGYALAARLYGLRGENRNAARAGVRAREQLLRAAALDPNLADADFGLGLYNYYADTLSAAARVLRFFLGIPGGNKQEGIRQLDRAMAAGVLTPVVARFYLAISLHNYDQRYEMALQIIGPLVEKYPSNPLFQLSRGDLFAKLGRKEQALECYRTAATLPVSDPDCRAHIQELIRASRAAVGVSP